MNINDKNRKLVAEDQSKLAILNAEEITGKLDVVSSLLGQDKVVLVKGVEDAAADQLIKDIAWELDLLSGLELHAGFAEIYGHRKKMSDYFMTVNKRHDYQCTLPHSEGSSFQNIQMVSFFCRENTTDGGETILFNLNTDNQQAWSSLRERSLKAKLTDLELTEAQKAEVKMRYQVKIPEDLLSDDDQILKTSKSHLAGLELVDVLSKPKKTFSKILQRELYGYWSSMSRFDSNAVYDFRGILRSENMYKEPPGDPEKFEFDDGLIDKRIWNSGIHYDQIFTSKLSIKLQPGDFIVLNNLSWVHGVNNWTPNSGDRTILAAMA